MHAGDWLRRGRAERAGSTKEGGGDGAADEAAGALTKSLLVTGDGWSLAVAKSEVLGRPPGSRFEEFLSLAADPRPSASKSWAGAVQVRAQADKSASRKLRVMLSALATAAPSVAAGADGADARPVLVSRENTIVAVNTVAAAAHVLGEDAVPNLGETLCRLLEEPWTVDSTSIRDACAGALTAIGTEEAFEELKAAVPRAQTKAQREVLLLCMSRMPWSTKDAKAAGASMAELVVPTHGLDIAGKLELTTHHRNFELTLHEDGSVSSRSLDDTEVVANEAADRVLRTELRAISTTYRKEVARIEALLATEHSWSPATWRRLCLDHPITRAVASRLVWRLTLEAADGDAAHASSEHRAIGASNGNHEAVGAGEPADWIDAGAVSGVGAEPVADAGGRAAGPRSRIGFAVGGRVKGRGRTGGFPVGRTTDVVPAWNSPGLLRDVSAREGSTDSTLTTDWPDGVVGVQLWHPREAAPEDLAAWRTALRELPFAQPFQQIERDFVASESDPEKAEFDQCLGAVTDASSWEAALAKIPWTVATKSGGKATDREDLIHREFPEEKVTATAMYTRLHAPATPLARIDRIRLGAAWIHRTDDKSLTPLPLSTLSARLGSEVERDLYVLMNSPSDAVGGPLDHTHAGAPGGPTDAVPD